LVKNKIKTWGMVRVTLFAVKGGVGPKNSPQGALPQSTLTGKLAYWSNLFPVVGRGVKM